MARRKGKSQRRVKDWKRRFRETTDPDALDEAHETETLQPQRVKLPAFRGSGPSEEALADLPKAEGMVTGMFPGGASVRIGREELLCRIAGTFRAPEGFTALTVGDDVTVARTPADQLSGNKQIDKDRADGVILSRQPRRTALSRPQPMSSKRRRRYDKEMPEKVVAANMDVLLIVVSTRQPPVRRGLIDRFCILAERGEMEPLIVFNKIDLAPPDAELVEELSGWGITVLACSALKGQGLTELLPAIQGRRSVLAGASGVGKSALVNAIVPGANLPTREIRMKDQRGRHVTAATTVHELPGSGLIVDTPGVRELATGVEPAELPWYFPEMAELAPECRFNDCTHTHEPDCAVRAAVEGGSVPPRRYRSYLRILESL